MKSFKLTLIDLAILIFLIAPFIFIAINWNSFPEKIATHFDMKGNPNDYMDKAWGLMVMPFVNIGTALLMFFLPMIDPRGKNLLLFANKFAIIRLALAMLLALGAFYIAFYSLGHHYNAAKVMEYAVLCLFIVMGNYLSSIRSNFFIGIRTPWTLSSEVVWKKTHRLAGRIWVFGALAFLVISLLFSLPVWSFTALIITMALIPMTYSFFLYRKLQNSGELK